MITTGQVSDPSHLFCDASRHDASGSFTPVPYATAFLVFVIDAAIVGCALLAARRPPGYARAFYASVVVAACGFGVLEMLPRWLRKGK